MSAITEETIRTLASFRGAGRPVVSVYLDVDGRRWPRFQECESRLERMVKEAIERAGASSPAADDLRRIDAHVKHGIDRKRTRGVAIFASGAELWEVMPLPVRVRDQLVVNDHAHVAQLEGAVENHARFGVLLADRQRARMFVFEMGDLTEKSEMFEALPRHDDDAGGADRRHDKAHVEAAAHQHLKRAAQVAFEMHKVKPLERLAIGAPDDILHELEGLLHRYLRERTVGRIAVAPNAPEAEVRDAAVEAEHQAERADDAALVDKVRAGAGAGKGAVAGVDDVLRALGERRIATLVVSDGYQTPGWRCDACGRLATKGRKCPDCQAHMTLLDDVVEQAIEDALLGGSRVNVVVDNADLDVLGRIGALLRF
ncbi:MAG TPA: hypothetical protein VHN98_10235 [Acidimicrobiales bacterium]|nr:hypothetical protein [Acidimicrobiales bacterium]